MDTDHRWTLAHTTCFSEQQGHSDQDGSEHTYKVRRTKKKDYENIPKGICTFMKL